MYIRNREPSEGTLVEYLIDVENKVLSQRSVGYRNLSLKIAFFSNYRQQITVNNAIEPCLTYS